MARDGECTGVSGNAHADPDYRVPLVCPMCRCLRKPYGERVFEGRRQLLCQPCTRAFDLHRRP